MRAIGSLVIGLALTALAGDQPVRAQGATEAAYVVSYVEVMSPSTTEATMALRQYRDASRQEAGNRRLEVLQQSGRPDHFAILETWADATALEAHRRADHTRRLRDALEPLRVSPYDERLYTGMAVGPTAPVGAGATYVVTHADAVPTGKDAGAELLIRLAGVSRQERGNARFEVLQQASRQNHFTLVEAWADRQALEAHAMSAGTRRFREDFQAFSGALWDERLYQVVE